MARQKSVMQIPWQSLFEQDGPQSGGTTVEFRVLRRGGRPFLFLPRSNIAARRALDLYPAQSAKARCARAVLKASLTIGFAPGAEALRAQIPNGNNFARFLAKIAGSGNDVPCFAVLAGNPNAPGRRFVFELFTKDGSPAAVVKAGHERDARVLIASEAGILAAARPSFIGLPRLRETFSSTQVEAFATEFIPGDSPDRANFQELWKIFSSWLDTAARTPLNRFDAWKRLLDATPKDSMPPILDSIGSVTVCPTLSHGDFAPWNVKVKSGHWTVLDWERGELRGIPGWDWLHFIVQPAVLVARDPATTIMLSLERLFASEEFASFARSSGIAGHERAFTLAYLLHCKHVTKQSEGLERIEALRSLIEERWTDGINIR